MSSFPQLRADTHIFAHAPMQSDKFRPDRKPQATSVPTGSYYGMHAPTHGESSHTLPSADMHPAGRMSSSLPYPHGAYSSHPVPPMPSELSPDFIAAIARALGTAAQAQFFRLHCSIQQGNTFPTPLPTR